MKASDNLWQRRPVGADARMRRWLLDRGSLTRRVQMRSRQFRVDLLALTNAPAHRDERELIEFRASANCAVREVALRSNGVAVVFAHSIAARHELRGPWRILMTLGARPLGAALFADPRIARQPLRFRQIRQGTRLYRSACGVLDHAPASLWARRSLFIFHGSRLLVTEVFLPAILALAL